ncbi:MAG TPA: hypothetical protein DCY27_10740 [Desulfobacterales bacterium]|nr:hypothetical protein [Desulfobacterales bacterium]
MHLGQWLAEISQSAAGPAQPFIPQWQYVASALVIPVVLGIALYGVIVLIEKICHIRLSGGGV